VGSVDPKEALLAQLSLLEETQPVPALTRKMIEEGLDLLSRHQFHELARMMKVSVGEIQRIASFISKNLNPYPGRSSWGESKGGRIANQQVFYKPDILITLSTNGDQEVLVVEILFPLWGTLRVNPLYRKAIQEVDEELKEDMRQDLERASLFVKCLQQRNHTMQRLMQRIVAWQKDFILKGDKFLKPLTRAQIAKELGVHESTVSRAVANKAVQLPSGKIIPLADFFDRSLSARIVLKELIMHETKPLSDAELVKLMAQRGYEVARRTVAKYRAMEGILPANLRRACY
jgi:RNA polymerase sigma-54 factor